SAVAVGPRRWTGHPEWHRHSLGGFPEREFDLGVQVVAAPRPARPRRAGPPEQTAEQVADVRPAGLAGRVEQVVQVELDTVTEPAGAVPVGEPATEPAAREQAAGPVVLLAFDRGRQHLLGLGYRLVSLPRLRITRLQARVP